MVKKSGNHEEYVFISMGGYDVAGFQDLQRAKEWYHNRKLTSPSLKLVKRVTTEEEIDP